MATSKITQEDAQEWLASLRLSGEGWYRNLALAIKANAHKALDMDRREFAAQIGQRMIDPREAIIELHNEGHSARAIGDILGVHPSKTVGRVLAEEGLIEPKQIESQGRDMEGVGASQGVIDGEAEDLDAEADTLRAEVEKLTTEVKGEQAKRKREVKELKEKLAAAKKQRTDELRRARKEAEAMLTQAERDRALKEAEAYAEEESRKIMAGLSHLGVQGIIGDLEQAAEQLRLLIEQGGLNEGAIQEIDSALAGFTEELNVARVTVDSLV